MRNKIKSLILCSLFAALSGAGAFIKIPIPYVPISLQSFFTTLAGLLLGANLGTASVGIYVIIGLLGIPIFTQGGGIAYVLQPTFGYLLGFILGAYVTGKVMGKGSISFLRAFCACFVGLIAIYAVGVPYFYIISNYFISKPIAIWPLLSFGFFATLPGDIIKCIVCSLLATKLIPIIRKENL